MTSSETNWPYDISLQEAYSHRDKPVHIELKTAAATSNILHGLLYSIDPVTYTIFLCNTNDVSIDGTCPYCTIANMSTQQENNEDDVIQKEPSSITTQSLDVSSHHHSNDYDNDNSDDTVVTHWRIVNAHAIRRLCLV